ncbi:hypothetical protein LC609_15075, partial [Nostoc sp. XA013]|nr:hypothetical protein [Nostoc sp. XA013]
PEAIPVYLLLSNRVNSLRLIPLVSSLIDTYWLLVCDRPVIDYINPEQWNPVQISRKINFSCQALNFKSN